MIHMIIMVEWRCGKVKRIVSAVEARKRLGEILERVYYRGDEVVIERAGKVMGVIVPADRYAAIERSRERLFALIEEVQERNRDVPYDVIQQEVAAAVAAVRDQQATDAAERPV
jgi:prevent-host-death family protein